jgi:hypothetical protein
MEVSNRVIGIQDDEAGVLCKAIKEVWLCKSSQRSEICNQNHASEEVDKNYLQTTMDVNIFVDANSLVGYIYGKGRTFYLS